VPLPPLIEIIPVPGPVQATVTIPGSKSITNRALILAALSENPRELKGALWSEDTEAMRDCLERLGIHMLLDVDPDEPANRSIRFLSTGLNSIANGGTPERPLELMVQNAGNAARFLTALVCLGQGCYRISGTPRMHERPQAGLFAALRQLGYRIDSPNDKLPAIIYGSGPHAGAKCSVRIQESSQFASALLLAAPYGGCRRFRTGRPHIRDDAHTVAAADRQHRVHAIDEERIEPGRRIGGFGLLGQRDGALGQALEHQVIEAPLLGELDRRLDPIARVAGAAADANRRLHSGNTPNRIAAATMSSDAANSHGAVNRW